MSHNDIKLFVSMQLEVVMFRAMFFQYSIYKKFLKLAWPLAKFPCCPVESRSVTYRPTFFVFRTCSYIKASCKDCD